MSQATISNRILNMATSWNIPDQAGSVKKVGYLTIGNTLKGCTMLVGGAEALVGNGLALSLYIARAKSYSQNCRDYALNAYDNVLEGAYAFNHPWADQNESVLGSTTKSIKAHPYKTFFITTILSAVVAGLYFRNELNALTQGIQATTAKSTSSALNPDNVKIMDPVPPTSANPVFNPEEKSYFTPQTVTGLTVAGIAIGIIAYVW